MIGSVSHGTMRTEDLIPTFLDVLKKLDKENEFARLRVTAENCIECGADDNKAVEIMVELIDTLNNFAPPYFYFGANPGDGSDYGFWLQEDWQERAKEDDVLFVSDLSEVPDRFPFGGLVCHVNDHGNATLYRMDYAHAGSSLSQLKEVWAVV